MTLAEFTQRWIGSRASEPVLPLSARATEPRRLSDIMSARDARRLRSALTVRDILSTTDEPLVSEPITMTRTFTERAAAEPRIVRTTRVVRETAVHFGLGAVLFGVMALAMMKLGPIIARYIADYAPQF